MMIKIFLFIACVQMRTALAQTPIRRCGNVYPMPQNVHLAGNGKVCIAEPCDISKSRGSATSYIDFVSAFNTSSIRPHISAEWFWFEKTVDLPQEMQNNPCGLFIDGQCPLIASEPAMIALEIPVSSSTPKLTVDTKVMLFGDGERVIFCYKLEVRMVD